MKPSFRTAALVVTGTLLGLLAYSQGQAPRQEPLLYALMLVESMVFGIGLAFVASAWPAMRDALPESRRKAMMAFVGIAWVLISWVFQDTITLHFGVRALDLVVNEHAYHMTLVASGVAAARYGGALMRKAAARDALEV